LENDKKVLTINAFLEEVQLLTTREDVLDLETAQFLIFKSNKYLLHEVLVIRSTTKTLQYSVNKGYSEEI
jgi:hypothetical protein